MEPEEPHQDHLASPALLESNSAGWATSSVRDTCADWSLRTSPIITLGCHQTASTVVISHAGREVHQPTDTSEVGRSC